MYDYTTINRFLQAHIGLVDPTAADKERIFNLYFDFTIYRVVVLVAKDYEIDLS